PDLSFGEGLPVMRAHAARMRADPPPPAPSVALDTTDGASLARTAMPHLVTTPRPDVGKIALALADARRGETSELARADLLGTEALVRVHGGDPGDARHVALAAVDAAPADAPWFALVR